ncbi:3-deoxy-D-manno-octulosonic-acid transferase [Sesbania bispinosa]|nr:3-deoxy-D-manno-octulosonic-acid transferase [Sesbania bispinosa]
MLMRKMSHGTRHSLHSWSPSSPCLWVEEFIVERVRLRNPIAAVRLQFTQCNHRQSRSPSRRHRHEAEQRLSPFVVLSSSRSRATTIVVVRHPPFTAVPAPTDCSIR